MIRYELFWQPVEMDTSSHFSTARQKLNETKLNERFHFCIPLKRATFFSRAVQSHPMNPLNYCTDIMLNYIPLSHPRNIHHAKYIQKVD